MEADWETPIDDTEMERLASWSPRRAYEHTAPDGSAEPGRDAGRMAVRTVTLQDDTNQQRAVPAERSRPAVITVSGTARETIAVEDNVAAVSPVVTLSVGTGG